MAASQLLSLEIEAEEMLFDAMLREPADQHVAELEDIKDEGIDVKNASQRTMLHQAVMLKKRDWVEQLLNLGADPSIEDRDGRTAVQLAKEMNSRHPGDEERQEILSLVEKAHEIHRQEDGKCSGSSAFVAKAIKDMGSKLDIFKKEIFADTSTIKRFLDDVNVEQKHTAATVKSAMDAISNVTQKQNELDASVTNVIHSLKQMETQLSTTDSTVAMQNNSFAELLNGHKHSISLATAMNEKMEEIQKKVVDNTTAVRAVKESIEKLANDFESLDSKMEDTVMPQVKKVSGDIEKLNKVADDVRSKEISIEKDFHTLYQLVWTFEPVDSRSLREECIEAMMKMTELRPSNDWNISKMKTFYGMMYDEDPITSCVIQFMGFQSNFKVMVDFGSSNI